MRIAFISYEFPPETGTGGIATYVQQAALSLASGGNEVWVFCGSDGSNVAQTNIDGVSVVRIGCKSVLEFAKTVEPVFTGIHLAKAFDVIEGPDYLADGHCIAKRHPALPLVLKLHSCSRLVWDLNVRLSALSVLKGWLRAVATARPPWWKTLPHYLNEAEHARKHPHLITAPSKAVAALSTKYLKFDAPIEIIPIAYNPSDKILSINAATDTRRVTFLGRLETRKGVLELSAAIPLVLKTHKDVSFRFIGGEADVNSVQIRSIAGSFAESIEFVGRIPNAELPRWLGDTDICVIPSRWENFPLVCLEAMAAARGVVASHHGGMSEMIENGIHGLLVNARKPSKIAAALCRLIDSPSEREAMGARARQRVLEKYSSERILPLQEAAYRRAIELQAQASAREISGVNS